MLHFFTAPLTFILAKALIELSTSVSSNLRITQASFEKITSVSALSLSHMAYLEALNPWHVGCLAQQNRPQ
jgi:hypothetical protein